MIFIAKRNGLGDKSTIESLKMRWVEENEEQTRKRSVLSSLAIPDVEVGSPRHRYQEGRKNGAWPEDAKEELARTLSKATERGGRYAQGRDAYSVQEVDAEVIK